MKGECQVDKRKANQNEDIDDLIFEDCDQSVSER